VSGADVIIVLGAPLGKDGSPSRAMRRRVLTAIELFHNNRFKGIIFSGGDLGGQLSEAEAMAEFAVEAGLERSSLSLESKARNTWENLALSQEIMAQKGWESVVVVSDDWHLPRARFCAEKLSVTATFHPVPAMLLPSSALTRFAARLREAVAMIKYRVVYR